MVVKRREDGLTRRDFMKTLGLGGMAAGALAASEAGAAQDGSGSKAATLPKRKLGKTGAEVSILSLGGMFDTINNQLMLKQALNWGVTLWDTAEAYGNGLSEEGFGRFFSRNPEARKEIFLVTKSSPVAPDGLTAAVDRSLKRLRTNNVDLWLAHGIASLDGMKPGTKEWAARMKAEGKFRFFGFSTHSNVEECMLAAAKAGWIDAIMFSYNFRLMGVPKMKEAVAACVDAGIGLIAMKTQGGGPVTTESEAEMHLAGKFLQRGFTDKQARLKAVWENPEIASICSQMPSLAILSANVAAGRDLTALSRNDFELLHRFAEETRTGYCAGCSRICREAVGGTAPISDVMRCLMYYRDYGDRDLARTLYAGLFEEFGTTLTSLDYSKAERVCPQGLAIGKLMREAAQLLA